MEDGAGRAFGFDARPDPELELELELGGGDCLWLPVPCGGTLTSGTGVTIISWIEVTVLVSALLSLTNKLEEEEDDESGLPNRDSTNEETRPGT